MAQDFYDRYERAVLDHLSGAIDTGLWAEQWLINM